MCRRKGFILSHTEVKDSYFTKWGRLYVMFILTRQVSLRPLKRQNKKN